LAYEARDVHYLFIRREDYARYVGSHLVIADIVVQQAEIDAHRKADFLARAAASVMREIEVLGFNPESLEHARLVSQATMTLVETKADIYGVLNALAKISDEILAHSVAVSTVSVMIAKELGWTKRATFEKIALGALLHDVGLKEIPAEIIRKSRAEMTFDEQVIYESHAFRGLEVLRTVPSVPDDVVSIAYEHHENAIGQGYPRKLRDLRMNPLAKVVALADQFVELTIRNPNSPKPKSAADAVKFIEFTMGQPFHKDSFQALRCLVNKVAS
ncbi:MAG: HD domain-containing protein, partial [Bdellovibrionaceae bacterium]|nr:HD domain-containing protein [Pseudobdellovibrionaceae bacterium]